MPLVWRDRALSKQGFVEGALGRLHRGELAAMRLALEQQADLLLRVPRRHRDRNPGR